MTCAHCEVPTADGVWLCIDCTVRLETILDDADDLLAEADVTIARMDRVGRSPGGGGASREGVNVEAMDRAGEFRTLLGLWARWTLEACDERGVQVAGYGSDHARLIREHTGVVRLCDWAGDCLDELGRAHRRLRGAVDVPPDVRTYGPCQIDGCAGMIRGVAGEVLARCRDCHEPYDATELRDNMLENAEHEPAPLAAVIRALNAGGVKVRHDRARKWVERGILVPDEQGLHTMRGVLDVLARKGA